MTNAEVEQSGTRGVYDAWAFLEFYYMMISINTILCNPNLTYSKSFLPCSRRRKQFIESH